MSIANLRNYVGGDWIQPGTQDHLDVENSATGQTICRVPLSHLLSKSTRLSRRPRRLFPDGVPRRFHSAESCSSNWSSGFASMRKSWP